MTESGRHVSLGAPGDRVAPDGSLIAGPHRQVPPCRHFPECGGCQLQHLTDEAFARFVQDRIASALAAQDLSADILEVHISPPNSRRRAALRAERRGNQVLLGFNAEASHRIVDMRECHILRPELFALVQPLRDLLGTLLGPRSAAEVRMTLADQGVDLLLDKVEVAGLEATQALAAFAETHRLARLSTDDGYGPQTRWEPEPATVTLGAPRHPGESRDPRPLNTPAQTPSETPASAGVTKEGIAVTLPHNAFLQATEEGEAALVASVRDALGPARIVADLFAGLGTFALALDGRILAAEASRDAAAALKSAANRAQRQVFVDHRDLFRRPLDVKELDRFEAIVLDPPRAGAREQVALLARSVVPRIAYVSCNPSSFARDAKMLVEGGYRLLWVRPVGQFRWSTHVELAAAFAR